MKTIELSDDDYETLMQLTKELREQPNHYQAFPYFWEPQSERLVPNLHGEGEVHQLYLNGDEVDPETEFNGDDQNTLDFLDEIGMNLDSKWEDLTDAQKEAFEKYLIDNCDCELYTSNYEYKSEHNPSLFLSDAQNFIAHNRHHLGRNPTTFARTIWRMPKMEKLVKIIYEIGAKNAIA